MQNMTYLTLRGKFELHVDSPLRAIWTDELVAVGVRYIIYEVDYRVVALDRIGFGRTQWAIQIFNI